MCEILVAVAMPGPLAPLQCNLSRFSNVAAAVEAAMRLRDQSPKQTVLIHAADDTVGAPRLLRHSCYLLLLGAPGQVLVSEEAAADWPPEIPLVEKGWVRLRDLMTTTRIYALPPDTGAPLKSLENLPHNLPPQFTSFVGRQQNMSALGELLRQHRLVTLTGPGGAGKTRLALQTAAALLDQWADGAWFVPLAGVSDPESLAQAAALAIDFPGELRDTSNSSVFQALVETYAARNFLLILDNCEHLTEHCAPWVRTLLAACPRCTVLCTSREPLGIAGEVMLEVPSLVQDEAVQLFVDRARALQPSFSVTQENAREIDQVCQRLDGLPLALELAAARVRVLPPGALARRLEDRFRLLTGGDRLALPRHQTLRAVVEWSHNLLSEPEQVLWRRVSVFAGRFAAETAEAVCHGQGLDQAHVLTLLAELADKSVIKVEQSGDQTYYRLLETIRQYGLERLAEAGEEAAMRRRHLQRYMAWVQQAKRQGSGIEQSVLFDRLEGEFDDLQAALVWSKSDPESTSTGLALANALDPFWVVRGYVREGARHFADLLALPAGGGAQHIRGQGLSIAGSLAFSIGDYGQARSYWEEGLAIARELGLEGPMASSLNNLGLLAYNEGKLREAEPLYTEALTIRRRMGLPRYVANTLINLADLEQSMGHFADAAAKYEESIALWNALGDSRGESAALLGMAALRARQGQLGDACRLLTDCLRLAKEIRDSELCVVGIERAAGLLTASSRALTGVRLLGAAEAQRKRLGIKVWEAERPALEHDQKALQQRVGESAFQAQLELGAAMELEAALDAALEALSHPPDTAASTPGGLSTRELEVVQLVARGLPDREIAAELHLSKYTVNNHLRNIYGKLGISSRAALTTWAFQQGITA